MKLTASDSGQARIIHVDAERIDAAVALQFKDMMRDRSAGAPGRILLDLGSVRFIDSSGLGAIVASMKQLDGGQKLELVALSPIVETVFRLTRMDTIFPIHQSVDDGLSQDAA
ncbi:STAS domain-containing protein [Roseivivax sp. CAU 1753]